MEKRKSFDAVAMVRKIRDAHYQQTKDMTEQERWEFYHERGRVAQEELEKLRALGYVEDPPETD